MWRFAYHVQKRHLQKMPTPHSWPLLLLAKANVMRKAVLRLRSASEQTDVHGFEGCLMR